MKKSLIELKDLARIARGDILKMTTVADSGHPVVRCRQLICIFPY